MSTARVAIGAVVGTLGGPSTYARELVFALAKHSRPDLRFIVITDRPGAFAGLPVEVMGAPLLTPYMQVFWDHVLVRVALRRSQADLYHGTKQVLPLGERRPQVVTIHDLAVYRHPATFSRLQRWHLFAHTPHALARAQRVIAVSQRTAQDIVGRFPEAGERLRVILNGVSPRFRPMADAAALADFRRRYGLGDGPVVLYVGTLQPRKGVGSLVEAFSRLARKHEDVTLVVAGRVRPGYHPEFGSGRERVKVVGVVADWELPALYAASSVMVSPSLYEGFGLTVVEAMACGCPVVALKAGALPEVAGDSALLLDSQDSAALCEAIERLLADRRFWLEMRRRGLERARRFSWTRAASLTSAVYREALGGGGA